MTESYRSWEDFLDHGPVDPPRAARAEAPVAPAEEISRDVTELLDHPGVPEETKALLRRHRQLEAQLKRIAGLPTGDEEEDPDARRKELAYPVFVHTKQTRIEQRRRRWEREREAAELKRRQERRLAERKRAAQKQQARASARAARERRRREAALARERKAQREAVAAERAELEARLHHRREEGRQRALREQAVRRILEQRHLDERLHETRRRLAQRAIVQRREESADERRRERALENLRERRREFAQFFT